MVRLLAGSSVVPEAEPGCVVWRRCEEFVELSRLVGVVAPVELWPGGFEPVAADGLAWFVPGAALFGVVVPVCAGWLWRTTADGATVPAGTCAVVAPRCGRFWTATTGPLCRQTLSDEIWALRVIRVYSLRSTVIRCWRQSGRLQPHKGLTTP